MGVKGEGGIQGKMVMSHGWYGGGENMGTTTMETKSS